MTPERRAEQSTARKRRLNRVRKTPKYQRALKRYLKSSRNPFRNPQAIKNPTLDFSHLRGGNGKPLPVAHRTLLLQLGLGWEAEFPVGVIPWKAGWPKCYRIDIAAPAILVAVEVDGFSHRDPRQRRRDKRKAAFLRKRGWTVLRFWNSAVIKNVESVVQKILRAAAPVL